MQIKRTYASDYTLTAVVELAAVLELWLFACSFDKLTGFQEAVDYV